MAPYFERIAELPLKVQLEQSGGVRLQAGTARHVLALEQVAGPANDVAIELALARHPRGGFLLLAPYVPAPVAQRLTRAGGNFIDLAGNVHLRLGANFLFHVEGRRPAPRQARGRGLGAPGYQLLFALLAREDLLQQPVRRLAAAAGVAKTTAAHVVEFLEQQGLLGRGVKDRRFVLDRAALLQRFVTGYLDMLRPRLLVGRYRTPQADPDLLEPQIEAALGDVPGWAFGGAAGAFRLTRHYRDVVTVLHTTATDLPEDLRLKIRAVPAQDGNLVVIRVPTTLWLDGPATHVAHPLLLRAELLAGGNPERAREALARLEPGVLTWPAARPVPSA